MFGARVVVIESNDPEFPEDEESWCEILLSELPENEIAKLDDGVMFRLTLSGDSTKFEVRHWTQEEMDAFHKKMRSPEAIANARRRAKVFGLDPDEQESYHRSLFRGNTCDKSSS